MVANVDVNSQPCITVYPLTIWESIEADLLANTRNIGPIAQASRYLLTSATEVEMDASGRILLPANTRDKLNGEKKAVIAGAGKKFEIWREQDWRREHGLGEERLRDPEVLQELVGGIANI